MSALAFVFIKAHNRKREHSQINLIEIELKIMISHKDKFIHS